MSDETTILLSARDQASAAIDRVTGSMSRLRETAQTTVSRGLGQVRGILETGLKVAAGAAVGALGGLFALGGKSIQLAAGFEQVETAFGTMLGSAEAAKDMMDDLFQFTAKTPFEFEQVAKAGQSLLAFGEGANTLEDTLLKLGNVAAGVNIPLTEISEIYGKARVQGRLFAEDINQLTGRGIPIIGELAKVLGVTDSEVKKMVEDGKVGFPELEKAFTNMSSAGGKFAGMMDAQSQTLNGIWSTLKDNVTLALAGIGKSLVQNLNLKELLGTAITYTTQWSARIQQLAAEYIPLFVAKISDLAQRWLPFLLSASRAVFGFLADVFGPIASRVVTVITEFERLANIAARFGTQDLFAVFEDGSSQVGSLLKALGLTEEVAYALGAAISRLVRLVMDVLGPIVEWVGQVVSLNDLLTALGVIVGYIAVTALGGLIAAMWPVIAVVGAATAAVATMRNVWENDFLGIRTFVGNALDYLQERFGGLFQAITEFGGGALREIWAFVTGNETSFSNLGRIWDTAKQTASRLFSDIISYVTNQWPVWRDKLQQFGLAAWQWIQDAVPVATLWLGNLVGGLLTFLGDKLPEWLAMLYKWATGLISWIGEAAPKAIRGLTDFLLGVTSYGEGPGNQSLMDMVFKWIGTLLDWIKNELVPKAGPEIAKFGVALLGALGKIALELVSAALKLGVNIILSIAEGLLNLLGIDVNLQGIKTFIFGVLDGWREGILSKGAALMNWFKDGILQFIETPKQAITAVMDAVKGLFNQRSDDAGNTFYSKAAWVIGRVREGFLSAQNLVRNGIDVVMDFMQAGRDARLPPFAQSLYDGASNAARKLGDGLRSATDVVKGQIQQVYTDVQNHGAAYAAGAFAGRLYESARAAIGNFGKGLSESAPNLKGDMERLLNGAVGVFNTVMEGIKTHFGAGAKDVVQRIAGGLASVNLGAGMNTALQAIIDTFNNVMDGFYNHVWSVMGDIGRNLIGALVGAIREGSEALKQALDWLTAAMPQWMKDKLGIHSPSTVFEELGDDSMAGYEGGVVKRFERLKETMRGLMDELVAPDVALPDLAQASGTSVNNNYARTNNFNLNMPFSTGHVGQPGEQVRAVFNQLSAIYTT